MVSRQKAFTTLVLLLSIMLVLAACVRNVPTGDTATATPDANVGGGTDGAPTPGGDQTQPTPIPGGDQTQPTPVSGGDQTQPTPIPGSDQTQPTPVSGGDQTQPTPASGGDQAQPTPIPGGDQTSQPMPTATTVPPEQGGGTVGVPPTQEVTHIVQPGENLFRIGLQYGYSWTVLAQYNGIPNPNYVVVGQAIRIPASNAGSGGQPVPPDSGYTYYVVQPGDNLFRIGLKYGMSWVWIAEANGITNPHYIVTGQVLKIPVYPVPYGS